MAGTLPHRSHNCSHIGRKRGVYVYRRRLPGMRDGEVAFSLRTKSYREAEHRAALLDKAFGDALRRARDAVSGTQADLNAILRGYFADALEADLDQRLHSHAYHPIYTRLGHPNETPAEADQEIIHRLLSDAHEALENRDYRSVAQRVKHLAELHGVPEDQHRRLALGVLEANVAILTALARRVDGDAPPLVFDPSPPAPPAPPSALPGPDSGPSPTQPGGPLASTLVDLFAAWGRQSKGWRASGVKQAAASVRLFIESAGDRPVATYKRADANTFREAVRQLPAIYRKAAEDAGKSLAEIIAKADASGAPRVSEKTAKRHFWALSQFFRWLTETGRLPREAENLGRGFSFNTKGAARRQKDMWSGDELRTLFASPVWRGHRGRSRIKPGQIITRDALFWLPLLGLYHGNRLEEMAQLRREDVQQRDGVWFLRITDEDGRQLKNAQSRRDVPLHPELIRLGFLDHVASAATLAADQVFPELKPGGPDGKLGFHFSKRFSDYRRAIGVHRRGLDYHSFRHGVTTKLLEANVSEAWVDLLTGHEGGGESRRRYFKSVPLPKLRGAIKCVAWPEVDLSALYTRDAGDERWPVKAAAA